MSGEVHNPLRAQQTTTLVPPTIGSDETAISQQGLPAVPDRLHAVAALSSWDCFTPCLESVKDFFNYLFSCCFSCFQEIAIVLGCMDRPPPPAHPSVAHMFQRWVAPFRERESLVRAFDQAVPTLASEIAFQAAVARGDQNFQVTQAHLAAAQRCCKESQEQQIKQIQNERFGDAFVKDIQLRMLASQLRAEATKLDSTVIEQDLSLYLDEALRIRTNPVTDLEASQQKATKKLAENVALKKAQDVFAELHTADATWGVYNLGFEDNGVTDKAATLFWADFQQLPADIKERILLKVKDEDISMINGFVITRNITIDEAVEVYLKAAPNEVVLKQLELESRQ